MSVLYFQLNDVCEQWVFYIFQYSNKQTKKLKKMAKKSKLFNTYFPHKREKQKRLKCLFNSSQNAKNSNLTSATLRYSWFVLPLSGLVEISFNSQNKMWKYFLPVTGGQLSRLSCHLTCLLIPGVVVLVRAAVNHGCAASLSTNWPLLLSEAVFGPAVITRRLLCSAELRLLAFGDSQKLRSGQNLVS